MVTYLYPLSRFSQQQIEEHIHINKTLNNDDNKAWQIHKKNYLKDEACSNTYQGEVQIQK